MPQSNSAQKRSRWFMAISALLVILSALVYCIQIAVFRKPEDTFFYMVQDLAFLPVQVLLVTIIISEIMNRREKQVMMSKLNMVIGAFFSHMGTGLLKILSAYDRNNDSFRMVLAENIGFSESEYRTLDEYIRTHKFDISSEGRDMTQLKEFVVRSRECVMRLLENPNLLEHESFTDLLWSVSHLTEEMAYRDDVNQLSYPDRRHLEGDIQRAYLQLTAQWLAYVRHLRQEYPYIYSLVVRINPFDPEATVEVK